MPIGDQMPRGNDDTTRRLRALEQAQGIVLALAGNAKALANAIQVGLGNLASSGTLWQGPVASPSTVTAGTDIAATGNVTAGNNLSGPNIFATSVFAANAGLIAGNITTARTQTWARNSDGYIGNTLSSIRFKTNVEDSGIDPLAVLSIGVKHYRYIEEVRKRDDPTYEFYVGPEYHVALEVGAIAEDLHAAGLWEFVVYEHEYLTGEGGEAVETLKLDAEGHPVPQSIHYGLLALAVLVATQHVWMEHLKVRADVDAILANLGMTATA